MYSSEGGFHEKSEFDPFKFATTVFLPIIRNSNQNSIQKNKVIEHDIFIPLPPEQISVEDIVEEFYIAVYDYLETIREKFHPLISYLRNDTINSKINFIANDNIFCFKTIKLEGNYFLSIDKIDESKEIVETPYLLRVSQNLFQSPDFDATFEVYLEACINVINKQIESTLK